jgi:hypothetical protein
VGILLWLVPLDVIRAARLLVVLALGLAPACTVLQVEWTGRQGGLASWYGPGFYGRRTARGTVYTILARGVPVVDDQARHAAEDGFDHVEGQKAARARAAGVDGLPARPLGWPTSS